MKRALPDASAVFTHGDDGGRFPEPPRVELPDAAVLGGCSGWRERAREPRAAAGPVRQRVPTKRECARSDQVQSAEGGVAEAAVRTGAVGAARQSQASRRRSSPPVNRHSTDGQVQAVTPPVCAVMVAAATPHPACHARALCGVLAARRACARCATHLPSGDAVAKYPGSDSQVEMQATVSWCARSRARSSSGSPPASAASSAVASDMTDTVPSSPPTASKDSSLERIQDPQGTPWRVKCAPRASPSASRTTSAPPHTSPSRSDCPVTTAPALSSKHAKSTLAGTRSASLAPASAMAARKRGSARSAPVLQAWVSGGERG